MPPGIQGDSAGDKSKSLKMPKKASKGQRRKQRRPKAPKGSIPEGQQERSALLPFGRFFGARWPSQKRPKDFRRSKLRLLRPALKCIVQTALFWGAGLFWGYRCGLICVNRAAKSHKIPLNAQQTHTLRFVLHLIQKDLICW